MKKFLLSMFAIASVAGVTNAQETKDVLATMYPGDANLIGWGADADGLKDAGLDGMMQVTKVDDRDCLRISNATEKNPWEVQFAFDYQYEIGQTYYFTFDVKGDPCDAVGSCFQSTDGWVGCGDLNSFAITSDWKTVTISGVVTDPGDDKKVDRWVASIGKYIGTFYISNMSLYTEGGDTPDEPGTGDETINVIASYFDGNGETFGGWGGTIEAVEEDGKPCLKYENAEAKDFWATQIAIDLDYEIGETYYFSFDVKGDGTEEITSGYQYAGKNNAGEQVYWGCGDVTPFKASPEWKSVVISGTTKAAEEGQAPGRWVANLGQYVGTLYITNVKVYTEGDSGVRVLPAIQNNRTVVYNLMGVKVLDTDDASQLNTLRKGIYIVNGKKVAL